MGSKISFFGEKIHPEGLGSPLRAIFLGVQQRLQQRMRFRSIWDRILMVFGRPGAGKNSHFAWEWDQFAHFRLFKDKLAREALNPWIWSPFWGPRGALKTDLRAPKSPRGPAERPFLGIQKGAIFNTQIEIRPAPIDPRTLSARDPQGRRF